MAKIKIVVTGGPSAGKTTLIEALQKDMAGKVAVVPEAASLLYRGGFPRKSTALGKTHAQRAIIFVQRELEDMIILENRVAAIVCDRGSLDGIAYWPGDEENFFTSLQTTRERELARYDWILHLDTTTHASFDGDNPIRIESHKEATELNRMIKEAWQGHPQRVIIPHSDEFLDKIALAKRVITLIMNGATVHQVLKEVEC